MTPTEISALTDRHLTAWLNGDTTLRDHCADMIREALALRDKQWEDGNATLRHELQQAQDTIDGLRRHP